jgi:hypothetical protein
VPAIGPYPEPAESTPQLPSQPISPTSIPIQSSDLLISLLSGLLPLGFPTKTSCTFLYSPMRATCLHPPNSLWLHLPNDIWGWVQIMKLLFVQLHPFSCYFIPLRFKYFPQTPSVYALLLIWDHVSHPYNYWENYSFAYSNPYIPGQQVGRQKTLNQMAASISQIQSALNLCSCNFDLLVLFPNIWILSHHQRTYLPSLCYASVLPSGNMTLKYIYLVSGFTSRNKKASVQKWFNEEDKWCWC